MSQIKTALSLSDAEQFRENLISNTRKFAEVSCRIAELMFSVKSHAGEVEYGDSGLNCNHSLIVSILFTGTVYGEYIFAVDEASAAGILGLSLKDKTGDEKIQIQKEIRSAFCEFLNMVVGESIVSMKPFCRKLTITAPRVYSGSLQYNQVKAGRASLDFSGVPVECLIYVDRMNLDIASSYKEALNQLTSTHEDLQRAMVQLQEQQSRLVHSEKMAALGTMAAGLAHEINTPLATVSLIHETFRTTITEDPIDRVKFIKRLDVVSLTVSQITKITNSMRTFALGAGKEALVNIPVKSLYDDALLLCESTIKKKGVNISFTEDAPGVSVDCQPPQLTQLLVHLLQNAADAAEGSTAKTIQVKTAKTGELIKISVIDSGEGIPTEILHRIFDPFFSTKGVGGGSGLGLSIAKGIADAHKATLQLDTASAATCFVLAIPKRKST